MAAVISRGIGRSAALLCLLLGTAGAAAAVQITNTVTVGSTTDKRVNTVTVQAANESTPGLANDRFVLVTLVQHTASVTTTVVSSADLEIAKSAPPGPYDAGAAVTYTITVLNHGPSSAADVTVTDPLLGGATFDSADPGAGGSCVAPAAGQTGTVTCTWAGATLPGQTRTLTLVVRAPPVAGGTLVNVATVSSATPDPNAANDSASAQTAVAVPIPALGVAGAALLAGLLAFAAALLLRRSGA